MGSYQFRRPEFSKQNRNLYKKECKFVNCQNVVQMTKDGRFKKSNTERKKVQKRFQYYEQGPISIFVGNTNKRNLLLAGAQSLVKTINLGLRV